MLIDLERRLKKELKRRNIGDRKTQSSHTEGILIFIFLVGIWFIYSGWVRQGNANISANSPVSQNSEVKASTVQKPIEKPKLIELPTTGVLQEAISVEGENLARLRVFLRAPIESEKSLLPATCSDDRQLGLASHKNHRFVKILDWESNEVIATAFVRSGEMVEIPLPLGMYKLRYAVGEEWYGEEKMFGTPYIYEMTDRFSTETAKFELTDLQPGADIGAYCDRGNLGMKTIKDDSSVDAENL